MIHSMPIILLSINAMKLANSKVLERESYESYSSTFRGIERFHFTRVIVQLVENFQSETSFHAQSQTRRLGPVKPAYFVVQTFGSILPGLFS